MEQAFLNAIKESVQISQQKWVKWQHELRGLIHCNTCLALHNCLFVFGNEPIAPLHEKCHCTTVAVPTSQVKNCATAISDYSKYDPYLFDPKNFYKHGKNKAFESWGYSIEDAKWLQEEIEKQGQLQYLSGNYELGVLNLQGQRISIRVTIPRKNGSGEVSFITGWMVKPGGKIKLTTPYGGNDMKELDCVEVIVEKEKYAKYGVHKGMQGWICDGDCIDGYWLVNFPQYGEKEDIAEINIKEEDLLQLTEGMDARINERIRAQFEGDNKKRLGFPVVFVCRGNELSRL